MRRRTPLLLDFAYRNGLFFASLCSTASGSSYTYSSGKTRSTIDYCLLDSASADFLHDCICLESHSLNCSDHLPITATLQLVASNIDLEERTEKIDWKRAIKNGFTDMYSDAVNNAISSLIGTPYKTLDEVNDAITEVSKLLISMSQQCLPKRKVRTGKEPLIY